MHFKRFIILKNAIRKQDTIIFKVIIVHMNNIFLPKFILISDIFKEGHEQPFLS